MRKWSMRILVWFVVVGFSAVSAHAMGGHQPSLGQRALMLAMAKLSATPFDDGLAMVTNAGYVTHQGESTGPILDTVTRMSAISRGEGNLLSVHARTDAPLFMVFVHKKGPKELSAVSIAVTDNHLKASEIFNLRVDVGTSFEPLKDILGKKAFAVATLANGYYDGIPEQLIQSALFHDHFCCGVASGHFTVGCILSELPLRDGESYTYIGVPSWCQDDYIVHTLNLTPGKKGYLSMIYPNRRPWKTASHTWETPGGIIIRFNRATKTGDASVLCYKWKTAAFVESLGLNPEDLDWHKDLWLHACYNRYVFQSDHSPSEFVSIHKTLELTSQADFDRLTRLGANPLAVILGDDPDW
ncbi:FmdE family protein [Desulfoluna sp.]|uniref:FmdE family protein n=1 Tax=Desulfoluna sp. TaxID=2045199 RepID=UPI00260805A0|nr:FmdE family protein [Desulfoluna sp.]